MLLQISLQSLRDGEAERERDQCGPVCNKGAAQLEGFEVWTVTQQSVPKAHFILHLGFRGQGSGIGVKRFKGGSQAFATQYLELQLPGSDWGLWHCHLAGSQAIRFSSWGFSCRVRGLGFGIVIWTCCALRQRTCCQRTLLSIILRWSPVSRPHLCCSEAN